MAAFTRASRGCSSRDWPRSRAARSAALHVPAKAGIPACDPPRNGEGDRRRRRWWRGCRDCASPFDCLRSATAGPPPRTREIADATLVMLNLFQHPVLHLSMRDQLVTGKFQMQLPDPRTGEDLGPHFSTRCRPLRLPARQALRTCFAGTTCFAGQKKGRPEGRPLVPRRQAAIRKRSDRPRCRRSPYC